jgi:hypothetical protein
VSNASLVAAHKQTFPEGFLGGGDKYAPLNHGGASGIAAKRPAKLVSPDEDGGRAFYFVIEIEVDRRGGYLAWAIERGEPLVIAKPGEIVGPLCGKWLAGIGAEEGDFG